MPNIPTPVVAVVSEVLAEHFTHAKLDTLFMEVGVSGLMEGVNKLVKCTKFLSRVNQQTGVDPLQTLGSLLEEFMEVDPRGEPDWRAEGRARIRAVLARHSLSYHDGGKVLGGAVGAPTRSLEKALQDLDLVAVEEEFNRCIRNVESDPPAALAAACSGIESLLKHYIQDEGLTMPESQTLSKLWKVVRTDLGWLPGSVEDDDLKRILTGLGSVVDGVGALRTHASAAHGAGRSRYRVQPRHARLAIHAAHTLAVYIIETWLSRR